MYSDLQFTKHIHRILPNGKLLEDSYMFNKNSTRRKDTLELAIQLFASFC